MNLTNARTHGRTDARLRMPAEWEPQEATLLSWPHNELTWRPHILPQVERIYVRLITEITEHQKVWLNVRSVAEADRVKLLVRLDPLRAQNLEICVHPTHDVWVRDYGPLFVYAEAEGKQRRIIIKWQFNGWGGKYEEEFLNDNEIPRQIAKMTGTELISVDHVLEGGSIDVNGRGTLLTSTDCLLNENRQTGVSRARVEELLSHYLGARHVIWAEGQIKGDDTDGHIDDAVRFVGTNQIVCISETNPSDINYESLCRLKESLRGIKDQGGLPITITDLPMPDPVEFEGRHMPASYANFLITNKKILVPIYACDQDQDALKIIGSFFPDRQTVGIDCRALVTGYGSIHCVSMQVPV